MKKVCVSLMCAVVFLLVAALIVFAPAIDAAQAAAAPTGADGAGVEVAAEAPVVETATGDARETDLGGALIDLTQLFEALWSVILLAVARYLIPWIRAHIKATRLAEFDYWTGVAVAAAEKAYGAGKGPQKLARATEIMRQHGFTIDEDAVDAAIKRMFESAKANG